MPFATDLDLSRILVFQEVAFARPASGENAALALFGELLDECQDLLEKIASVY